MSAEVVTCPISGAVMQMAFQHSVLNKYDVRYYYCEESGLLKTQKPYWLGEVYRQAIADTDTGLVSRNLAHSAFLEPFLSLAFDAKARFLDVAGGYGLLARLLRDKGFDCFTTDPYCKNIFAPAFEPGPDFKANALFAFEVLEHIEDPWAFVNEKFTAYGCRTLVFSTLTFAGAIPPLDWWYYAFSSGQHITFYQPHTLDMLAERLNCRYYMINPGLHVISDLRFRGLGRLFLTNKYARRLCMIWTRLLGENKGNNQTWEDHLHVKAMAAKAAAGDLALNNAKFPDPFAAAPEAPLVQRPEE